MSLEYAIEYSCEMRRRYGEAELRQLGRKAALVSRIVSRTLETERSPSQESIDFTSRLSEDLEKAETIAMYCHNYCPANVNQIFDDQKESPNILPAEECEPIGCLGRIRYPIEGHFEQFVADRVQLISDTVPMEQWPNLLRILIDPGSPFDGELTKELRRITTEENLRFYERRFPITLTRQAARLTTDHIFDLFSGFLATDNGESGYQRELPVAALEDFREFLQAILLDGLTPSEMARLRQRGTTYTQFIRLTRAIMLAESLEVRILMD